MTWLLCILLRGHRWQLSRYRTLSVYECRRCGEKR